MSEEACTCAHVTAERRARMNKSNTISVMFYGNPESSLPLLLLFFPLGLVWTPRMIPVAFSAQTGSGAHFLGSWMQSPTDILQSWGSQIRHETCVFGHSETPASWWCHHLWYLSRINVHRSTVRAQRTPRSVSSSHKKETGWDKETPFSSQTFTEEAELLSFSDSRPSIGQSCHSLLPLTERPAAPHQSELFMTQTDQYSIMHSSSLNVSCHSEQNGHFLWHQFSIKLIYLAPNHSKVLHTVR